MNLTSRIPLVKWQKFINPTHFMHDVPNILRENEITVLCMQEIDLEPTTNPDSLSINESEHLLIPGLRVHLNLFIHMSRA